MGGDDLRRWVAALSAAGLLARGARVNLEIDPIARYVERMLAER